VLEQLMEDGVAWLVSTVVFGLLFPLGVVYLVGREQHASWLESVLRDGSLLVFSIAVVGGSIWQVVVKGMGRSLPQAARLSAWAVLLLSIVAFAGSLLGFHETVLRGFGGLNSARQTRDWFAGGPTFFLVGVSVVLGLASEMWARRVE
jgi:hypothetical protein